jgi:hypothetical protein
MKSFSISFAKAKWLIVGVASVLSLVSPLAFSGTAVADGAYRALDANTIEGKGSDFSQCTQSTAQFQKFPDGTYVAVCTAFLPGVANTYTFTITLGARSGTNVSATIKSTPAGPSGPITIADPSSVLGAAAGGGTGGGGTGADTTPDKPTCDWSINPLTWIICPIVNGLADATDGFFQYFLVPFLKTTPLNVTDTNSPIFKAWSSFRVLANIILIIALLLLVFGQAIGVGIFSAYQVKTMAPAIFIYGILANISIYLWAAAIDVFNIAGAAIAHLILVPFGLHDADLLTMNINVGAQALSIGAFVAFIFTLIATGGAFLMFLFLFLLLPLFLTMIGVFITLMVRTGIIMIASILAAPFAALGAIPATRKYLTKYLEISGDALAIYPVAMAFVAVFKALGSVITVANGQDDSGARAALAGFVGILLTIGAWLAVLLAIRFVGGLTHSLYSTVSGYGKQGHNFVKGNPNDPFSMQNRTKRTMGHRVTDLQAQMVHSGRKIDTNSAAYKSAPIGTKARVRGRQAAAFVGRRFGNVDARLSHYQDIANKQGEQMSQTGLDDLRYAAAGFKLSKGQLAGTDTLTGLDGSAVSTTAAADYDRYFDSKGREITGGTFNEGKRRYGATVGETASQMEYTVRKAQGDKDLANFRYSLQQNAKDEGWSDSDLTRVWATATYPHKERLGSEWYSTPKFNGNGDVEYNDVGKSPDNYNKMVGEVHKVKKSFQIGNIEDSSWRSMAQHQEMVTEAINNGGIIQKGSRTGQALTPKDYQSFAMTDEVMEAAVASGGVQRTGQDANDVQVMGGTPAAKGVIQAMFKNRQYRTTNATTASGQSSVNERIIYDGQAAEAAKNAAVASFSSATPPTLPAGVTPQQYVQQQEQAAIAANTKHTTEVTGDIDRTQITSV